MNNKNQQLKPHHFFWIIDLGPIEEGKVDY